MMTVGELAKQLNLTLEGDPSVMVSGVASPERAHATHLIFVESAKQLPRAARSLARCTIVPQDATLPG